MKRSLALAGVLARWRVGRAAAERRTVETVSSVPAQHFSLRPHRQALAAHEKVSVRDHRPSLTDSKPNAHMRGVIAT